MIKFAANLSFLYQEHDFLSRFEHAKADGFDGVEFLFPYAYDQLALRDTSQKNDLPIVLFNVRPGNWEQGERGIAALPGREDEFKASIDEALEWADALQVKKMHILAGLAIDSVPHAEYWAVYKKNLQWAVQRVAQTSIQWQIEPINHRDMPRYVLTYQEQARQLIEEINSPNLALQMDFYHCQIMEGDLVSAIQKNLPYLGHLQIAGVPDRHEPDTHNEVAYEYVLRQLDAQWSQARPWHDLWVGCEYRPRQTTKQGLAWLNNYQDLRVSP